MGFLPDPLHPAIVHFPIALVVVALCLEVAARRSRWRALEPAAATLIVLGALGAIAAVLSGLVARDEAVVPQGALELIERHEELGELAMWALVAAAGLRLLLAWRRAFAGFLAWAYILVALGAVALVSYNGHLGGQLVFRHGIGTAPVQRGTVAVPQPSTNLPPRS